MPRRGPPRRSVAPTKRRKSTRGRGGNNAHGDSSGDANSSHSSASSRAVTPPVRGPLPISTLISRLEIGKGYNVDDAVQLVNTEYTQIGIESMKCRNLTPNTTYPGQRWCVACDEGDFYLYFFHGGLEPYQPHLCNAQRAMIPFRPALKWGEQQGPSATFAVFFSNGTPAADAEEPFTYIGQMKFGMSSSRDRKKDYMVFVMGSPREINRETFAILGDTVVRGCKRNKYGLTMCQSEIGNVESSDDIPLGAALNNTNNTDATTAALSRTNAANPNLPSSLQGICDAISQMPKVEGTYFMSAPTYKANDNSLLVRLDSVPQAAADMLLASFQSADEHHARQLVKNLILQMIDPSRPIEHAMPVICEAINGGRVEAVTFLTMYANPVLMSDHLAHAIGAAGIAGPGSRVTTLHLSCTGFSARGLQTLCKGIAGAKTLNNVKLYNCCLSPEQIEVLAPALFTDKQGCDLTHLNLSSNKLNDASFQFLISTLVSCPIEKQRALTHLTVNESRLADSKIRIGGTTALSAFLSDNNTCRLSNLSFERSQFSIKGFAALLPGIAASTSLNAISFKDGKCGGGSNAAQFVATVRNNCNLTKVEEPTDLTTIASRELEQVMSGR